MAPGQESGTHGGLYRFGEFTLDTARAELLSGQEPVKLRPQSYEVLVLLITHAGELLSKDFIHEKIWGNRAVTDDSLTQCLIEIRRAIGDTDRSIVRTVPRRGYMFTAEVAGPAESETSTGAKRVPLVALAAVLLVAIILVGWLLTLRTPSAPAPLENSVAVLPFADRSAGQDEQYLGDGLSEGIMNRLGHVPELQVIARTSSFAMAEQSTDIATIRDRLRVAYVLEGSVSRTSDAVKIVAQLVETGTGTSVWSQSYDVNRRDLSTVQQAIVTAVAASILPYHGAADELPVVRAGSASEAMLLGQHYENQLRSGQTVEEALLARVIELYREAVEAEPDSALAHSRLAGALLFGGDIESAGEQVFRALTLGPDTSEVLEVLGRYYWALNRLDDAGAAWKKAMALNPSNVDALSSYASWLYHRVGFVVPAELYRRAVHLDPLNLSRYADLGFTLAVQVKREETEAVIESVRERFDSGDSYVLIASLLEYLGRQDESIAWTIAARDLEPDDELYLEALAERYVDIGDVDTALKVQPEPGVGVLLKMRRYDEVIDEAELLMIEEPGDVRLRYVLAFAYNAAHRPDDALRIFARLNMLDPVFGNGSRNAEEIEAALIVSEVYFALGDEERARGIAEQFLPRLAAWESADWWKHVRAACVHSILGNDEEAFASLQNVIASPRLPWMHVLRDRVCFRRLHGRDEYEQVLQRIEARQADLRRRLPQTLQEFGVTL